MKQHKVLLLSMILVIVLASAMVFSGCGGNKQAAEADKGQTAPTEKEKITLKYGGGMPPTHHITEVMNIYAKKVGEKTGNQVTLELYPGSQLYDHTNLPGAVSTGAIDMAELDSSMMGGISEAAAMSTMSFLIKDWDQALEVHDKYFDLVDTELQAKGAKLLFWMPYGTDCGPITTKKKITKLEDFKGLKIRGIGEIMARWLEAAGASPAFISSPEVYQSLSNGAIDGAVSGYGTYFTRRWYETSKYMVGDGFNYCMFLTVMNLKKWQSLPKDVQDALISAGKETETENLNIVKAKDKEYLASLEKEKVDIYWLPEDELNRWKELMVPIYEEWSKRSPACKQIIDDLLKK